MIALLSTPFGSLSLVFLAGVLVGIPIAIPLARFIRRAGGMGEHQLNLESSSEALFAVLVGILFLTLLISAREGRLFVEGLALFVLALLTKGLSYAVKRYI